MPDPSWDIEFSETVNKLKNEYSQKLNRKGLVGSIRRDPRSRAAERAYDQQDAFEAFLRDLSNHGAHHRDPNNLPEALDKDGNIIPDCFIFEDDPWTAYLWRDESRGVAVVVLLFDEEDREKILNTFTPTNG